MKNRRFLKFIICLIAAATLFASLGGCASFDNFKKTFIDKNNDVRSTIHIAVLEPQSGDYSAAAADEIEGMILANEIYKSVLYYDIELIFYDNESDVEKTKEKALEIVESDAVLALGSYGNALSLAAGDIFLENKLPAIAATCSNPLVMQLNQYYVSANSSDTYEALAAAEFASQSLGSSKAAAIYITGSDYTKAKADAFQEAILAANEDAQTTSIAIPEGTEDYNEFLETIGRNDIDTIYLPETAEKAMPVITAFTELGYKPNWIGTESWETSEIEGLYYVVEYDPGRYASSVTNSFMEAYAKKYGTETAPSKNFALGFDAYLMALNGIESAMGVSNKDFLAEKIRKTDKMPGATGSISIDENGNTQKAVYIHTLTKDGPVQAYVCTPKTIVKETQTP